MDTRIGAGASTADTTNAVPQHILSYHISSVVNIFAYTFPRHELHTVFAVKKHLCAENSIRNRRDESLHPTSMHLNLNTISLVHVRASTCVLS